MEHERTEIERAEPEIRMHVTRAESDAEHDAGETASARRLPRMIPQERLYLNTMVPADRPERVPLPTPSLRAEAVPA